MYLKLGRNLSGLVGPLYWTDPVSELSEEEQIHLYSSLAANQMSLGNIQEAIKYSEKCLTWFAGNNRFLEASAIAGPYISMLIAVGRLQDVEALMQQLYPYIESMNNSELSAMGLILHAYMDYLRGNNVSAAEKFQLADEVISQPVPGSNISFPTISSYYCKFLLETGRYQAALERLLRTFGWRQRKTWQIAIDTPSIYASDLLVLGLTFLTLGDLINARKYLDQQVELFRSSDEWLYLPTGLHSRARYFIKINNFEAASADLEEALQISERTGAVFGEWESYLNFAQLHRIQNQPHLCEAYLQKAQALSNMDMYKFRNDEISELKVYIAEYQDTAD